MQVYICSSKSQGEQLRGRCYCDRRVPSIFHPPCCDSLRVDVHVDKLRVQ